MNKLSLIIVLPLLLSLFSCSNNPEIQTFPRRPGYVLSGNDVGGGFRHNALTIVDTDSWRIYRAISLPNSFAKNFSIDVKGRIWIGFSGGISRGDNRLQVYSSKGELLKTIKPCQDPEAGISFVSNSAFVACAENGFTGKIVSIDINSLTVDREIKLSLPKDKYDNYLLISSSSDDKALIVSGLTADPKDLSRELAYSAITIIDPNTLSIEKQLPLGKNTDVWRILSREGQFYLLNVGGWRQPKGQENDIIVTNPKNSSTLKKLAIAPSPTWGEIRGDVLYSYHNPTWNQAVNRDDIKRYVSRLNLKTGERKVWHLPNEWDADDLDVMRGKIILTRWLGRHDNFFQWYFSGDPRDGLYEFDQNTGQLKQLIQVADASNFLLPPVSQ